MDMMTITPEEWEQHLLNANNQGKETILQQLAKDGMISEEQADYLSIKYQIITYNKKSFTKFFRKWFKVDENPKGSVVYNMIVDTGISREEYDKKRLEEKLNGE